jgi:Family of unknown function (DUF6311)
MKDGVRRIPDAVIPVLLGVAAFFGVTGGRPLLPRNIAWLTDPDAQAYFIGWHYYRFSPWGIPPGVSPRYGAEISSSIAFIDNVPLFAIPFKALSPWLPDPFQYFGLWTLCCFVLHAWFAWLLVGLITRLPFARACGAALFVFAPPFLWRLQCHYQMCGQWLLLAALYLCFGPRRLSRGAGWPLVAFTVSLVHSYMTAMVLGLWACDLLRRLLFEGRKRADFVQIVAVPGLIVFGFWLAGLFMMGKGITKFGFGYYRMNLLSLVDPSGWSYVLKDLPEGPGDYEGFNYLGLGALLLVVYALPALKDAPTALRSRPYYWPLALYLLCLTLFSISNRVGLGRSTFEMPLSQAWVDRANVLRTCGRMFWPAFYVVFWILVRTLFKRYPPKVAAGILFLAVMVQAADTSAGWRPIRQSMEPVGSSWPSPLQSPFWSQVPDTYREIRMVVPRNRPQNWEFFAYFASHHGMSSDAWYGARIDQAKLDAAKDQALAAVNEGIYSKGAMYVLERRYEHAARKSFHPDTDFLGRVDGFSILAPGWRCRPACLADPSQPECSTSCPKK